MLRRPMMAAMLALSVVLSGCGSDNDPDADAAVVGEWEGSYGGIGETTGSDYQFIFFANGTMQAMGHHGEFVAEEDAIGTWDRDGNTVTGTYEYANEGGEYSFTGTLSATTGAEGTTLTGTWGGTPSNNDGGGFVLTKQ